MTFTVIEGGCGTPEEPDWLDLCKHQDEADRAASEWRSIVDELRAADALSVTIGHLVKRLVISRVMYDRALTELLEKGPVISAKKTGVQTYNAYFIAVRQLREMIASEESALGVAPTRRKNLSPVAKAKKRGPRAADEYLGQAKP